MNKRQAAAVRAAQLLGDAAMTRYELERALGISQQRVSEVLRAIDAKVIGEKPAARQGRPAPVYSLRDRVVFAPMVIGRVSSVFDLATTF